MTERPVVVEALAAGRARVDVAAALRRLGVEREPPSLAYLGRLQLAFKHHVPWETVSRIVRRAGVRERAMRPRRPAEFWRRAIVDGTGGTCFESNYALWALITALGFACELRINDMPRHEEVGTHAAVVATLDGERYAVDVGLGDPLRVPLPLTGRSRVTVEAGAHRYTVLRQPDSRYELLHCGPGTGDGQTEEQMYVLVDRPVTPAEFDARVVEDYGPAGLFLEQVTLVQHRADGTASTYRGERGVLAHFDGERWSEERPLEGDPARVLSRLFGVPERLLSRALALSGDAAGG